MAEDILEHDAEAETKRMLSDWAVTMSKAGHPVESLDWARGFFDGTADEEWPWGLIELTRNGGGEVDWKFWTALQLWTPEQFACLVFSVCPRYYRNPKPQDEDLSQCLEKIRPEIEKLTLFAECEAEAGLIPEKMKPGEWCGWFRQQFPSKPLPPVLAEIPEAATETAKGEPPQFLTAQAIAGELSRDRVEIDAICARLLEAVQSGNLPAEVALRKRGATGGFEPITSITQIRQIHDYSLGHSWVMVTIHRKDYLPWAARNGFKVPDVWQEEEAATEGKSDWRNDSSLTKGAKQERAISACITLKGWEPMSVPDGEKGTLKMLCESEYPELFEAVSAFDEAWKRGRKSDKWRMQSHASYAHRGGS